VNAVTMRKRSAAKLGAATVMALSAVACTAHSSALGTHMVRVAINGEDTAVTHPVRCEQVNWLWTIDTLVEEPGLSAMVQTGPEVDARSVQIRDLGGFTGSFWEGTTGKATADVDQGTFTITGVAEGFYVDAPNERSTATFRITTNC